MFFFFREKIKVIFLSYFVQMFGCCPVNCSWKGNTAESWKINQQSLVCFACGPFVCFGSGCSLPRCVFSFLVMLLPSALLKAQQLIFCQTLIREALLCAQRTQVQTYSEACSCLLETPLKSPFSLLPSELSPEKLGGHDSILSSLLPEQLSAVTAAAPWDIILAFDHFSSWQQHSSLIIQRSIFGLPGLYHPGDFDVCGCLFAWKTAHPGIVSVI